MTIGPYQATFPLSSLLTITPDSRPQEFPPEVDDGDGKEVCWRVSGAKTMNRATAPALRTRHDPSERPHASRARPQGAPDNQHRQTCPLRDRRSKDECRSVVQGGMRSRAPSLHRTSEMHH